MRDRGQHADAERNQLKRRNNTKRAAAANGRVAVRQPKLVAIPNAEADAYYQCHRDFDRREMSRQNARPAEQKSQINTMIASQKIRYGNAHHFARSRRPNPRAIGNQSGSIWTSWRKEPWLASPTTYKATSTARQEKATFFDDFGPFWEVTRT